MKALLVLLFTTTLSLQLMAQTITDSIMNQGVQRTFHYHVPSSYNGIDQLPVVVVLHGGNSDGLSFMNNSYFDEIADTASYIALFPDAYLGNWTDGRGNTPADSAGIDDISFLPTLIDSLAGSYAIDTCRLYVTGISNGGMMTHRLACERSETFQGYASIAASLPSAYYPSCSPTASVNLMMIHGTEDNFSPYAGGPSSVPSSTGTVTGIDSTITFWANHNNCTNQSTPDSTVFPDINTTDNGHVVKYEYQPCDANKAVALYKVYGGGHTLPGGPGPVFVPIVGYSNKDVNGAAEIWKFFSDKSCSPTTSSVETIKLADLKIYPNPASDRLTVETNAKIQTVVLYQLDGRAVISATTSQIDVSSVPPGVYIVEVQLEDEQHSVRQAVVKH